MVGHDIIVIGASAGGVEALTKLLHDLPPNLPAAIFVVLHIPSQSTSVLPNILNRCVQKSQGASLQAVHPQDSEAIQHGRIYVAPPNYHLLLKDGYIRLARGPKENSHRPAVDPMFRTAARAYGQRVVGVVLSDTLDDGTAGLTAVKMQGGVAVVQNPDEALYSGMPRSAIENVDVDYILPLSDIASILVELASTPVKEVREPVSSEMEIEADIAELELNAMQNPERPGTPSPFACPECAGVLWEIEEGKVIRFRCRTGHAYSVNTLLAEQSQGLETALWTALRALEEKAALNSRMAGRAQERKQKFSAQNFAEQAQYAQEHARLIRQMLLKGEGNSLSSTNGHVVGDNRVLSRREEDTNFTLLPWHLVAIYAPANTLQDLGRVLSALPADFPAAITVIHHLSSEDLNQIADILSDSTSLTVKEAAEGDSLRPGVVYIAPPNKHLLVNPDKTLSLSYSKLVHFVCPSVDLLFESVAASFKQQAIALLLPGTNSDSAIGIQAIKKMGGTVIAQQVNFKFGIPNATYTDVDWLPLNEIAATLVSLVKIKDEQNQE